MNVKLRREILEAILAVCEKHCQTCMGWSVVGNDIGIRTAFGEMLKNPGASTNQMLALEIKARLKMGDQE